MYLPELDAMEELLGRWANLVERRGDKPAAIIVRELLEEVRTEAQQIRAKDRQYEKMRVRNR